MLHSINVYDEANDVEHSVKEFSSTKFDSLFMRSVFPHNVLKQGMEMTEQFLDLKKYWITFLIRIIMRQTFKLLGDINEMRPSSPERG